MIYTQRKDRKEQIQKYREERPNEEEPKKVRNIEIKLVMMYDGWKEIGENRYELVGKEYVSGYMIWDDMVDITNANVHRKIIHIKKLNN